MGDSDWKGAEGNHYPPIIQGINLCLDFTSAYMGILLPNSLNCIPEAHAFYIIEIIYQNKKKLRIVMTRKSKIKYKTYRKDTSFKMTENEGR